MHTFTGVYTGTHVVTISDVSLSCIVHGERWQSVKVKHKQLSRVAFSVACAAPVTNHIAFASNRDGRYDIWRMADDGSNPVNLTRDFEGGIKPAWSPDGTQIAYSGSYQGASGILVMDSDGRTVRVVTNDNGYWPTWSPRGDQIAYDRYVDGTSRIYLVDVDGSNNVPLFDGPTLGEAEPAWSPDGRSILYTGFGSGNTDLYVVGATGGVPVRLTSHPSWDWEAAWSPDGQRIAFLTGRRGNGWLYVMDADGGNKTPVFQGSCMGSPSWSPDGTRIAFHGYCGSGSGYEILSIRPDGTGLVQLTDAPGLNEYPAYSPGN
jgi:TolB protein